MAQQAQPPAALARMLGDHRFWEAQEGGVLAPIVDPLAELVLDIEGSDDPNSYRATVLADVGYDTQAPEFFGAIDPADDDSNTAPSGVQIDVYMAAEGASELLDTPVGQYPFIVRMLFCERLFWVYCPNFSRMLGALGVLLPLAQASLARQRAEQRRDVPAIAVIRAAVVIPGGEGLGSALEGTIAQAVNQLAAQELDQALLAARTPEDRIQVLTVFGQIDAAEQEADALEAGLGVEDRTPLRLARIQLARGHIQMYRQDSSEAVAAYSEARRQIELLDAASRDKELEITILHQLGHALLLDGQLDVSEQVLERAVALSRTWRGTSQSLPRIELVAWGINLRGDLLVARYREKRSPATLSAAEAAYQEALGLLDEARAGKHNSTRRCCERGLAHIAELRAGPSGEPPTYFQPKTA